RLSTMRIVDAAWLSNAVSSRRKPHPELAPGRLGVAQERLGARQALAAFNAGDRGLAGAHARSEFGLRQTRARAGLAQFRGDFELGGKCIVFGLDLGI